LNIFFRVLLLALSSLTRISEFLILPLLQYRIFKCVNNKN
jgi:hypothetical protein